MQPCVLEENCLKTVYGEITLPLCFFVLFCFSFSFSFFLRVFLLLNLGAAQIWSERWSRVFGVLRYFTKRLFGLIFPFLLTMCQDLPPIPFPLLITSFPPKNPKATHGATTAKICGSTMAVLSLGWLLPPSPLTWPSHNFLTLN